jgi:hypothetical protein
MNKTKEEIEQIAEQVLDAMLKVHTEHWGPACEVALPVRYEGNRRVQGRAEVPLPQEPARAPATNRPDSIAHRQDAKSANGRGNEPIL